MSFETVSLQTVPRAGVYQVASVHFTHSQKCTTFFQKLLHHWEGQYQYAFVLTDKDSHPHYVTCCPEGTMAFPQSSTTSLFGDDTTKVFDYIDSLLFRPTQTLTPETKLQPEEKPSILIVDRSHYRTNIGQLNSYRNRLVVLITDKVSLGYSCLIYLQPTLPVIQDHIRSYHHFRAIDYHPERLSKQHFVTVQRSLVGWGDSLHIHAPIQLQHDHYIDLNESILEMMKERTEIPNCIISLIFSYLKLLRCCEICRQNFRFQNSPKIKLCYTVA